ncbi:MAG: cell division protein FtsA [Vulcanibacillus sp.]
MNSNDFIVSLDIGTSNVRVIIGEFSHGVLHIIGVGISESEGIKKGAIVDIDLTAQAIREAVENAERMVEIDINEVYVGISGNHIEMQLSQGVVAVSSDDREINGVDIERVVQASKVIALPPNKEIIDVVPKEFVVDGLGGIKDPSGMIGVRLEVTCSIITGSKTIIHNLIRTLDKSELQIAGFVLMPLAASQVALSKDEMNLGIVLIDIGKGTTEISIFEHGDLIKSVVIPIGGEYITNDISIGLKTQMNIAEQVKVKYGVACIEEANQEIKFRVPRIGSNFDKEYNQIELAHIIEPRVVEIFQIIRNEVNKLGYTKEIAGGYVLTGGVASMNGILTIAQEELKPSVRIAYPDFIGVRDPSYINGVGIILSTSKKVIKKNKYGSTSSKPKKNALKLISRIKEWLKDFV